MYALRYALKFKRFYLLSFCILFVNTLSAQCYSDNCIDGASQTTSVPGCCSGTTVGMTTSYTGTVGCAVLTGGQDAWMTFIAPTNGFLNMTFTAGTIAGTVNILVFDSFSNADNCSTLSAGGVVAATECFNAATPPNPIVLNQVQAGERYFILVSSPVGSTPGSWSICLSVMVPTGGMDCPDATKLCTKDNISLTAIGGGPGARSGSGNIEDVSGTSPMGGQSTQGLVGSCLGDASGGGGEAFSQWYQFTCGQSGTLQMGILPNNTTINCAGPSISGDDYDWILLDVTKTSGSFYTCNINGSNFGGIDSATILACNYSGTKGVTGFGSPGPNILGYTGTGQGGCQTTDAYVGSTNSTTPWVNSDLNITCGRTYVLMVSNFTNSTSGLSMKWGGTSLFGVQNVAFNDPTINGCSVNSVITAPLCSGSLIFSYRYEINWGDGSTTLATSTNINHTYASPGTYNITILVTDPSGCTDGLTKSVYVNCFLPIELIDFSGQATENDNLIYWSTASEHNNDFFTVEKSANGIDWELLATITGAGNSQSLKTYSTRDIEPLELTYYRLKQTDFDGSLKIHAPITIRRDLDAQGMFSELYPNPTNDQIYFNYSGSDFETPLEVTLSSIGGKVIKTIVYTDFNKNQGLNLSTDYLSNGMYQVVLKQGEKISVKRITVLH